MGDTSVVISAIRELNGMVSIKVDNLIKTYQPQKIYLQRSQDGSFFHMVSMLTITAELTEYTFLDIGSEMFSNLHYRVLFDYNTGSRICIKSIRI